MKRLYLILVLLHFSLLFNGCIDAPTTPGGNTIYGSIYDYNGFPIYSRVSAGDFPIVAADPHGKYMIENVSLPYDLNLSWFGGGIKYLNINQ